MTSMRMLAGTVHALSACKGYPTLVLRLEHMQEDIERFMFKLYAMLHDAGVRGLQMPARHAMRTHFGAFLKANQTRKSFTDTSQPQLTRSQVALVQALQLVGNSPNYGVAQSAMRADAVMRVYQDTLRSWNFRSDAQDLTWSLW